MHGAAGSAGSVLRRVYLQEIASRSETRVLERYRTAKMGDSRPRFSSVGCLVLSLTPACHAGGRGFEFETGSWKRPDWFRVVRGGRSAMIRQFRLLALILFTTAGMAWPAEVAAQRRAPRPDASRRRRRRGRSQSVSAPLLSPVLSSSVLLSKRISSLLRVRAVVPLRLRI